MRIILRQIGMSKSHKLTVSFVIVFVGQRTFPQAKFDPKN